MATLYKVGTANWNTLTWATTSGGTATNTPTAADDCVVDANSGNFTINAGSVCRSWTVNGFTGTITHASGTTLTIGDATVGTGNHAINFATSGWTYTRSNSTSSAITLSSTSTTAQTITTNGKTLGNITIASGNYQLNDNLITAGTLGVTSGIFSSNNNAISCGILSSTNSNVREIYLGTSTVTNTGTGAATIINFGTSTNLTIDAAQASLVLGTTSSSTRSVSLGGKTWGTISYTVASSTGALSFSGTGVINTLTVTDGGVSRSVLFTSNTYSFGQLNISGTSSNHVSVLSSVSGTRRFVSTFGLGPQVLNHCTIQDIRITEPYKIFATNSTDNSNNVNIVFSAPPSAPLARQSTPITAVTTATNGTVQFLYPTIANNLLVCILGSNGTLGTVTPPSGWTQAHTAGTTLQVVIFYKIADGSETTVTPSWVNSASPQVYAYEIGNWGSSLPQLDTFSNSTSSSSTSLLSGTATNSAAPGISIVGFAGNGGLGASSAASLPTNNFQEDYNSLQTSGSVMKFGLLPLTTTGAQSTTFTWSTSRVPISVIVNFVAAAPSATNTGLLIMFS